MKAIVRGAFILFALCLPASSQDGKKPDDILQKRDGGLLVGRVLKMDGEMIDFLANGEKEARKIAPKDLMPKVSALNWGRPTSEFAVLASYYYLRDNLQEHVAEISGILQSRRDTMLGAIGEFMGSAVKANHPDGGLYLWVGLPEGANTQAAAQKARERGVAYLPGTSFSPSGATGLNYLRLCFGYEDHQGIRDGIATLAEVFVKEGLLK